MSTLRASQSLYVGELGILRKRSKMTYTVGSQPPLGYAAWHEWADAKRFAVDMQRLSRERSTRPNPRNFSTPLDRLQPGTVMVEYIRHALAGIAVGESHLYLGQMDNPMAGDNSNNGHHVIDLEQDEETLLFGPEGPE